MASTKDSFLVALNAFKQGLDPSHQAQFSLTTLGDVKTEMRDIQVKQKQRKGVRDLVRIQSFLEAMDQFGRVIEIFLNGTRILSYVWGPIKLLLQTASCTAGSYDTLLDAYSQIGESMPLLEAYKDLFEHDTRMQEVLVMMFEDILSFHQKALHIFQQPMWQRFYKDLWQDFKSRFSGILNQLKRHRELIESQGLVVHLKQYRSDRERLFRELEHFKIEASRTALRSVIEWMAAADTAADHDAAIRAREKYIGTGSWILRLSVVAQWIHLKLPSSSMLWLDGKPGAGKTVLASVIIEYLISDQKQSTAYFYCKHNNAGKRTYRAVLKGVLGQLTNQERHLLPFFQRRQEASCEVTLSSTKTCEFLLETALRNKNDRTFIIIDGLDECSGSDRKDILAYFHRLVKNYDLQDPGRLRLLILSQDEPDIGSLLRTATKRSIQTADNMQDIVKFVGDHSTALHRKFPDLQDKAVEWISKAVCQKADGMFLFAKLVMENLEAQQTLEALQDELKPGKFPEGLQQAYERIVARILHSGHLSQRKLSEKLLKWIIGARRPFVWREIQAMASLDLETSEVDFNGRRIRGDIKDLCGSLIEVQPGGRIEFVHRTASYYLTTYVFKRKAEADMSLAAICIQYLTLECFEDPESSEREMEFANMGHFAFEDYAIAHWGDHILATVKLHSEDMAADFETAKTGWDDFSRATTWFQVFYESDFAFDSDKSTTRSLCQPFVDYTFFDSLLVVVGCARAFDGMRDDQRDMVQLPKLHRSLERHRNTLQLLLDTLNFGQMAALQLYYGHHWFKCSKLTCYYFHEGFLSKTSLIQHEDRHTRPYCCPYEDCAFRTCGFASAKMLQKHKQRMHAETEERPDTFGALQTAPEVDRDKRYKCPICSKAIGRSFNLKMHMRSHEDTREQSCAVCSKSFVRRQDRIRHERTICNFHSTAR